MRFPFNLSNGREHGVALGRDGGREPGTRDDLADLFHVPPVWLLGNAEIDLPGGERPPHYRENVHAYPFKPKPGRKGFKPRHGEPQINQGPKGHVA